MGQNLPPTRRPWRGHEQRGSTSRRSRGASSPRWNASSGRHQIEQPSSNGLMAATRMTLPCQHCSREFTAARSTARFCSPACKKSSWRNPGTDALTSSYVARAAAWEVLIATTYRRERRNKLARQRWHRDAEYRERRQAASRKSQSRRPRERRRQRLTRSTVRFLLHHLQHGLCAICERPITNPDTAHIDHRVPVAAGGTNDPDNLGLTHAACNLSKGSRQQCHD